MFPLLTTKKPQDSDKADDDWVAKQDPSSGKTYYYNKKTNETSFKPGSGSEWIGARIQILKDVLHKHDHQKDSMDKTKGFKAKDKPGTAVDTVAETTTTTTTTTTTVTTTKEPAPQAPEASNDRFAKIRQIRNKRDEAPKESEPEDKKPKAKSRF